MAPLIQVQHLSKKFGSSSVLEKIEFVVETGDIFGIVGLSGAGKSTLLRCLAGLEAPTSGSVSFEGVNLATLGAKGMRRFRHQIGMIFQHFHLFSSRTAAENISFPLEIAKLPSSHRVDELLSLVGLDDKKALFPAKLSGGEKQRVGIARALACRPKILFCDEATSALDPKTTREILALLKKLHSSLGLTIVLITHQIEVVRSLCTKVAVLHQGRIVEQGSISQVFSDPKSPITQELLLKAPHEIPSHLFHGQSERKKLFRLSFRGQKANEPIIARMVNQCGVEVNIVMGWIDSLDHGTIGTLIVELSGSPDEIGSACRYLDSQQIHYEALHR